MDIREVSVEEYAAKLEQQIQFMNRQLTIQGVQIENLLKELAKHGISYESSNGRSDEEDAGLAGRPEQNGAVGARQ